LEPPSEAKRGDLPLRTAVKAVERATPAVSANSSTLRVGLIEG
jgi:hypothetical protein